VADPLEISRRVRRRIERNGLSADVVADVNIAVSTGSEPATVARVETYAPIHQGRSSRARREASQPKEHP
jgi:hypothetical protein